MILWILSSPGDQWPFNASVNQITLTLIWTILWIWKGSTTSLGISWSQVFVWLRYVYVYIYRYRYMYICLLMLRMFVSPPFQSSLFPLSSTSAYPWEKFVSYIIMMDLISACRRAPWDPYGSQTKMLPGASKWMQKQSNSSPTWETQCDTNYIYIYN